MIAAIIVFMVIAGVVSVCALGILIYDIIREHKNKSAGSGKQAGTGQYSENKPTESKSPLNQSKKRD